MRKRPRLGFLSIVLFAGFGVFSVGQADERVSWLDLDVGLFVSSSVVHRGATLYTKPLIWPFAVVRLWGDTVSAASDGVVVNSPRFHGFRVFGGLYIFEDHAVIRVFGAQKDFRHSRPTALEAYVGTRYQVGPLQLTGMFSQGVTGHKGEVGKFEPRIEIYRWKYSSPLSISLFAQGALGFGSGKHNQYLYGSLGGGGLSFYEGGVGAAFWNVLPRTYMSVGIYGTGVLGSANRDGALVSDRTDTVMGTFTIAYNLPI